MSKINTGGILLVLLLISAPVFIQASALREPSYSFQADSTKEEAAVCYEVFGMDCPGCESGLEKQLKKIEGVEKAKASWERQQVVLWISDEEKVTEEEIVKRIKKANFTPGEKISPKKDEK